MRWDRKNSPNPVDPPYTKDPFAPDGRNAEDLGLSILVPSSTFSFDLPLITPVWALTLSPGQESECSYNRKKQRYCAPIKTIITAETPASVNLPKLMPNISFAVKATGCPSQQADGALTVRVYTFDMGGVAKKMLMELPVQGSCSGKGFSGTTDGAAFGQHGDDATFVVAKVAYAASAQNSSLATTAALSDLTLLAHYESTKASELQ